MKLIRFGKAGHEKPGVVLDENTTIDVSAFGEDYDEAFFGSEGSKRLEAWLKENKSGCPKVDKSLRIGPAVKKPSKIICVGLNYRKHAEETNAELPKEPVLFFKATTALTGPNDDLIIPRGSKKTDWEVELAVVIGKTAKYVDENKAMDHVAGYVLHNDYSEREYQLERSGQWVKGKSADTFAPLGPFIATKDEIPDPHNLNLWLKVNGKMMQNENTNDLVFKVPQLVSYISQFMTLLPGDIISTGTPAGVGLGMKPPLYLKDGDVVELGIQGLGTSSQKAKAYENSLAHAN
jgi:2-keto-4-pentenoate hydratase/2-oxohepta-3-ene-1,7-dioic acid hydratase in catechol pathway